MGLWHFGATALDRWVVNCTVAKTVARHTSPAVERPARVLTWAADEHVLGVIAGGLWLAARAGNERERRQTDHLGRSEAQKSMAWRRARSVPAMERWNFPGVSLSDAPSFLAPSRWDDPI
jgi:hypothetical protein